MSSLFELAGEVSLFGLRAIGAFFRRPFESEQIRSQIADVGSKSLPLVIASGFALGAVLTLHTRSTPYHFRRRRMDSDRTGAGILSRDRPACNRAAGCGPRRLGHWRSPVQHASHGADRCNRVVIRRLLQIPCRATYRCVYAGAADTHPIPDFSGLLGGFVSEYLATGFSSTIYISRSFSAFELSNFYAPTLKTAIFGFLIGTISSFLGYTMDEGADGVGRAATRSVVASSLLIILLDVLLIKFIFFMFPESAL